MLMLMFMLTLSTIPAAFGPIVQTLSLAAGFGASSTVEDEAAGETGESGEAEAQGTGRSAAIATGNGRTRTGAGTQTAEQWETRAGSG